MSKPFEIADQTLLAPVNLNHQKLEQVLGQAMSRHVDSADIYLQCTHEESWTLEDGIVKDADYSIDRGFGLRIVSGEKTGFAYADDINQGALLQAAKSARSIAYSKGEGQIKLLNPHAVTPLYPAVNPLNSLADKDKVALLQQIDRMARAKDPRVTQVIVNLSSEQDIVMVLRSDGTISADVRPLVCLSVRVIVEEKGKREQGFAAGGGRDDYLMLTQGDLIASYVDKAVRQALTNLQAVPAPAGMMPVVLGPGWPAVLLHEAIGHGLEGDFNRKGSSAFSGRLGERVASDLCTIVDDGTLKGRRGSLTVDDEGTPTSQTVLIEKGVLKNYMQDTHNAKLMKMQPTGNGRRESYAHQPLPRMTNTYMLPGEHDPQEIISSVENGIYAVDFAGGQVDITSGKFVFSLSEGYLIENGKVTQPIKGATLIGNGPDILTQVTMVGNDLALDSGIGTCGKDGQSVPVGVGQPTLKIKSITVGGQ